MSTSTNQLSVASLDGVVSTDTLLNRLSRGVALLETDGRVSLCNDAFAKILGLPDATAVVSKELQTFVSDDDRAQYRRAVSKAQQAGSAAPQIVLLATGSSESTGQLWVKVICTRYSDAPGERRVVVELSNAVEARKRQVDTISLQQRLYHAEQLAREVGKRARVDAHEAIEHRVRTSLTSIVGYSEMLLDTTLTQSAREEAMATIRSVTATLLTSTTATAPVRAPAPAPLEPRQAIEPAPIGATPPRATAVDAMRGRSFRGRVLVVEDSKDNQRLMSFLLRKLGLDVELADHGQDAMDRYDSVVTSADLVLLDMQMPELDGYQTASAMRARGYTKPIVALTANVREGDREQCLSAGCTDYLSKPIDRRQLVTTLTEFLPVVPAQIESSPASNSPAYYDPQPVPISGAATLSSADERRRLQNDLPSIASQLWSYSASKPLTSANADAARKALSELAKRARDAQMTDVITLADEAETSIRLGADAAVVQQALGRLMRAVSARDDATGQATYAVAA
jgi:CheY-like chemotaxis protein